MWKRLGKIVLCILIIALLIFMGGALGMIAGGVIGIFYLPVKLASVIKDAANGDISGDDEI